jgi:hypothetical protein
MAQYKMIAAINHPDETGWTKEMYPEIAVNYEKIIGNLMSNNIGMAIHLLKTHFSFPDGIIEIHNDWEGDYIIEDGDGIYLFEKI